MPLPNNFSPTEHIQDVILRIQNAEVRREFSDLGGDDWEPDISIPRGSLRYACTHQDNDDTETTIMRLWLYYIILRKAKDLQTPYYGMPIEDVQAIRKFKPQIHIYFSEDKHDVEPGYDPLTGEISFRLMNEESTSITHADLVKYAQEIKSAYSTGSGYTWKKGKTMYSYTDRVKGYQLQLLCRDKAQAKTLVEKTLSIQNHIPDWKYLRINDNEEPMEAYPTVPPKITILGKQERLPRHRPICTVRFRYATMTLHGRVQPIILLDKTGQFDNVILN